MIDHLCQPLHGLIALSHKRRLRVRSFLHFSKLRLERVIHLRHIRGHWRICSFRCSSAHSDNGAKLRLHMLNSRAEKGAVLPDVFGLHPMPE
jgi:hypothetical protein